MGRSLAMSNLHGSIPSSFENLVHLKYLFYVVYLPILTFLRLLYNNFLNGTLPNFLGQLTFLEHMYLNLVFFNNNICSEFASNSFVGKIPDSYSSLTRLVVLCSVFLAFQIDFWFRNLAYNKLSGEIPSWILNFKHLETLWAK